MQEAPHNFPKHPLTWVGPCSLSPPRLPYPGMLTASRGPSGLSMPQCHLSCPCTCPTPTLAPGLCGLRAPRNPGQPSAGLLAKASHTRPSQETGLGLSLVIFHELTRSRLHLEFSQLGRGLGGGRAAVTGHLGSSSGLPGLRGV